jgi:glutaminase
MHVCAIELEHVIGSVTAGCEVFTAGDIRTEVAIQSISKVFTMARVIEFNEGLPAKSGVAAASSRCYPAIVESPSSLRAR